METNDAEEASSEDGGDEPCFSDSEAIVSTVVTTDSGQGDAILLADFKLETATDHVIPPKIAILNNQAVSEEASQKSAKRAADTATAGSEVLSKRILRSRKDADENPESKSVVRAVLKE